MSYKKTQVFVAVNLIQATYDAELPFAALKELFWCFQFPLTLENGSKKRTKIKIKEVLK